MTDKEAAIVKVGWGDEDVVPSTSQFIDLKVALHVHLINGETYHLLKKDNPKEHFIIYRTDEIANTIDTFHELGIPTELVDIINHYFFGRVGLE